MNLDLSGSGSGVCAGSGYLLVPPIFHGSGSGQHRGAGATAPTKLLSGTGKGVSHGLGWLAGKVPNYPTGDSNFTLDSSMRD